MHPCRSGRIGCADDLRLTLRSRDCAPSIARFNSTERGFSNSNVKPVPSSILVSASDTSKLPTTAVVFNSSNAAGGGVQDLHLRLLVELDDRLREFAGGNVEFDLGVGGPEVAGAAKLPFDGEDSRAPNRTTQISCVRDYPCARSPVRSCPYRETPGRSLPRYSPGTRAIRRKTSANQGCGPICSPC